MTANATDKNRILIVDDEPGNIKILSNVLADDYALSVAISGAQALEIAKVQLPDIVLLDMVMPEMDGICLLDELTKRQILSPVIVLSACEEYKNVLIALQKGASILRVHDVKEAMETIKLVESLNA